MLRYYEKGEGVIGALTRGREVDLLVRDQGKEMKVQESFASLLLILVFIPIIADEVCRDGSQGARPGSRRHTCRPKLSEYYHSG